jgi:alpha-glucuronidase
MRRRLALLWCGLVLAASAARAEDGYELWLRYRLEGDRARLAEWRATFAALVAEGRGTSGDVAVDELRRGLGGILGRPLARTGSVAAAGALVVGTPRTSPTIARLGWGDRLRALGPEGYVVRTTSIGGHAATVVASDGESGLVYGAFHLLRLLQTGAATARLDVAGRPRFERRLLNHWDNLDGTVERGYAGPSLWNWSELPLRVDPRLADYARANASLGLNGSVLNNVNADPAALSADGLRKAAAVAAVLRPYGIRVYLSANFAAPKLIGGLDTADPRDPGVAAWWRKKADEVYAAIPDFGGFVVKANSEGQPGPQDYGRSHADGANVLADALEPHGGVVFWRAFVYDASVDADRVKRAYLEFVPLDGRFRPNVILQVKNGPLDFQPREPFHPLFGAMPKTPLAAELQITQEYLGQSNHLVYLAPMWKEVLEADTFSEGPGSSVARVLGDAAIAGVANTGSDRNWCGHPFGAANWYAFGRLAWDPELSAEAIADEWIAMTWGREPRLRATVRAMMLGSRETFVRYTMPLGLHHLIGGDHYAPMPENDDPRRADWSAIYYHRADKDAIGFDRTRRGSAAVDQYYPPLRDEWNDPARCPENLLLWFHRLPWDHRLASGRTLWDEIVRTYRQGAEEARALEESWRTLEGRVDAERYESVRSKLRRQAEDANAWSEHAIAYFGERRRR